MQIEEPNKPVATVAKSSSNVVVHVHPLVILNVQDHGIRAQYVPPKRTRVLGAILGKRDGRDLELINSIEIKYDIDGGKLVIDENFLERRLKDYKTMFPSLDVLGWYSSGTDHARVDVPFAGDMVVQEAI